MLIYLAEVAVLDGDPASALPLVDEALRIHREAGDPWGVGSGLSVLGRIDEARGDLHGAAARFAHAVEHLAAAGVERAVPAALADLAAVVAAAGGDEAAARLAGASRAWQARVGPARAPLPQSDRSVVLDALAAGPHAAAWRAGTALSPTHVLREVAAVARRAPPPAPSPA